MYKMVVSIFGAKYKVAIEVDEILLLLWFQYKVFSINIRKVTWTKNIILIILVTLAFLPSTV